MDEQMTPEERAKRLDKIRKCLALSKSPEPHEAAAAMRQAQKMMEQLGVSEDDVDGIHIDDTLVRTREGFGACLFVNKLSQLVGRTFGVEVVNERNPGSADRLNVRYMGPRGRTQLAEYTHTRWCRGPSTQRGRRTSGGSRTTRPAGSASPSAWAGSRPSPSR